MGIALYAKDDQPLLAVAIANAFKSAGLQFDVIIDPKVAPAHGFIVFVATKPRISN